MRVSGNITSEAAVRTDEIRGNVASQVTCADNLAVTGTLNVASDVTCGDLTANAIYGGAALQIQAAIAAANPFWVAGRVRLSDLAITASSGRHSFTVARPSGYPVGGLQVNWTEAHPLGNEFASFTMGEASGGGNGWQIVNNVLTASNTQIRNTSTRMVTLVRDHTFSLANATVSFFVMA
jgi:hypothetical protein